MADLGAQPTKNSVRITSTTGDFCTVSAATGSSAGVMSAEDKRRLDHVWSRLEAMGSDVASLSVAPLDMSGFVRRDELKSALHAAAQTAVALRPASSPAPALIAQDMSPRITALEAHVARLSSAPGPNMPASIGIESRVTALEDAVLQIADNMSEHKRRIESLDEAVLAIKTTLKSLYVIVAEEDENGG